VVRPDHELDPLLSGLAAGVLSWSAPTLLLRLNLMASVHSEPLSQRLATIREQLKLLADYL